MSEGMKVGSIFETEFGQLRQVVEISTDYNGKVRVSYNSKSAKIAGRDFEPGHNKTNPPLDTTFKTESGRMLSDHEIRAYVESGILEESELIR